MIKTKIIKLNKNEFLSRFAEIASVYKKAFAGFPWFENLSQEEVRLRLVNDVKKKTFECLLAIGQNAKVQGCLWFDDISIDMLRKERGQELVDFAQNFCKNHVVLKIVWEREIFVSPDWQRQKIASQLRSILISHLETGLKSVLLLTKMRDDNTGIIKIAEKLGFRRTGIRAPSSQIPDLFHEYWFKYINGERNNWSPA